MYANLAKIFPGDLLQNLKTPSLSGRIDRYVIWNQFLETLQ